MSRGSGRRPATRTGRPAGCDSCCTTRSTSARRAAGKYVLEGAHEPLVSRADFDAAQATRTLLKARDGSIAGKALLGGLIRCAGCGHTLKIAGNTSKKTRRALSRLLLHWPLRQGPLPRAGDDPRLLRRQYVEEQVLEALRAEGGPIATAVAASQEIEQAAQAVSEAEHELDLFIGNPKLLSLLGEQKFLEGVEVRQRELDEARTATGRAALPECACRANWPMATCSRLGRPSTSRRGAVSCMVCSTGSCSVAPTAVGKAASPLAERTQIVLRGNVLLEPDGSDLPS